MLNNKNKARGDSTRHVLIPGSDCSPFEEVGEEPGNKEVNTSNDRPKAQKLSKGVRVLPCPPNTRKKGSKKACD